MCTLHPQHHLFMHFYPKYLQLMMHAHQYAFRLTSLWFQAHVPLFMTGSVHQIIKLVFFLIFFLSFLTLIITLDRFYSAQLTIQWVTCLPQTLMDSKSDQSCEKWGNKFILVPLGLDLSCLRSKQHSLWR